jgi:hypothetical protein
MNPPLTVGALARITKDWPEDQLVLIGSAFPDCTASLAPVTCVVEDDVQEIPFGLLSENAGPLDLALAALRYQLTTPFMEYNPDVANQLFQRAFTAIQNTKKLQRGLL